MPSPYPRDYGADLVRRGGRLDQGAEKLVFVIRSMVSARTRAMLSSHGVRKCIPVSSIQKQVIRINPVSCKLVRAQKVDLGSKHRFHPRDGMLRRRMRNAGHGVIGEAKVRKVGFSEGVGWWIHGYSPRQG